MNKLLSEKVVNTLNTFQLSARQIVEGFMVGLHKSPYHGFSAEFADHKQYIPGDQIKDIDWKVYAKTNRYYVRRYEEETNLRAYIILDHSNSMSFKSHDIQKLYYAKMLSASLTYLISRQKDAVGLFTFNNDITFYQAPRTHQGFISGLYKKLFELEADSTTNSVTVLHKIAEKIKKRSLIIIISDLLDSAEDLVKGFRHFKYQNHEVIVFHITDPQEREFLYKKETIFIDSETAEEVRVLPWQIKDIYKENYSKFFNDIKEKCAQSNIEYVPLTTETPLEESLLRYLVRRERV